MKKFNPYSFSNKDPRPKQKDGFRLIDQGQNVLANFHTSYGKTWVALYLAQKVVDSNKQFVVGCPLKAVVEQHLNTFQTYFKVLPVSGDYQHHKSRIFDSTQQGFIMTYEMIYQILIKSTIRDLFFQNLGALIIDEFHLLASDRGPIVESLIYLVQYFFPDIQLLFLSATTGNPEQCAVHFQSKLVKTTENERPIPLKKEIWPHSHPHDQQEAFNIIFWNLCKVIENYNKEKKLPQMLAFCQSRSLTKLLHRRLNMKYPSIQADYHHAGRTKEYRTKIEEQFRKGGLDVIFCTPTLTMGVNVPADIVFVTSVSRYNYLKGKTELISSNELLQMIGRAGRPGQKSTLYEKYKGKYQRIGKAIILCEKSQYNTIKKLLQTPLLLHSYIPNHLKYILCTWIAGGIKKFSNVMEIYQNIFIPEINEDILKKEFRWLTQHKFIVKDRSNSIYLRRKGEIVAYFAIQPETVLHLIYIRHKLEALNGIKQISMAQLFCLILLCDEFLDSIQFSYSQDADLLHNIQQHFLSPFLFKKLINAEEPHTKSNMLKIMKAFSLIYNEYLVIRYGLLKQLPFDRIIKDKGDLRILVKNAQRILSAAISYFGINWKYGPALKFLLDGLECSYPVFDIDIITLMKIKGVGLKKALILNEMGITSPNDLLKLNTKLTGVKSKSIVQKINRKIDSWNKNKMRTTSQQNFNYWRGLGHISLQNIQKELKKNINFSYSLLQQYGPKESNPSDILKPGKNETLESYLD